MSKYQEMTEEDLKERLFQIENEIPELERQQNQIENELFFRKNPQLREPDYNGKDCGECNCVEISEFKNGGNPVKQSKCLKSFSFNEPASDKAFNGRVFLR